MTESTSAEHIIVVGAGMVGLSTAWFLQEEGYRVTVIDRKGVAAGSSWGNAGWLSPGMAMPLAERALWGYLMKSLFDPNAPLSIPIRVDLQLWRFLLRFITHASDRAWKRAMDKLTPIDKLSLASYDELIAGGVKAKTNPQDFIIGFVNEKESRGFLKEIQNVEAAGQEVPLTRIENVQDVIPQLSEKITVAYRMGGQRFIAPGPFVHSIADAVRARGGEILVGNAVSSVEPDSSQVNITLDNGEVIVADKIVLATGAWLPKLAKRFGVKEPVQGGRGYSFSVPADPEIQHPVYLPVQRVACTPYEGRFRIAGTMEFLKPDEPLKPKRIQAIINSIRDLFTGLDLDDRQDEWVGSRPVSTDGLPLIGVTKHPRVYVAGGHGMWGIVLGPATGKLLAQQIAHGKVPAELMHFDPLR